MTHIVVCGYPRSGSTLLYNMLRTTVTGHLFFDREIPALKAIGEKPRITKSPNDVFQAGQIGQRTKARFIVMLRDPRAVLVSRHANSGGRYKIGWDYGVRTSSKMGAVGRNRGLIERDEAMRKIPDPVVVGYEELVADPGSVQGNLGEAFGFRYAGRFVDFHKSIIPPLLSHQLNGIRPVETGRVESWRDHPERIREQFIACPRLFELLIEYGYEKDREWFTEL